ncbi:hypothetical protein C9374_003748 [Naegleria lovaniensis]|uniref:Cytidyltransferase-like domain-containing protein n=1 Tax=Naegleria lovaniensis TaxID=51637 RepID=A0AA88KSV3_NAELO|nr:uncharacterized protein C9374_003748 [Naegleria lovaniensis]KAG2393984.1 hypothetical protein C9374_003748 [Naegleria lovaniensis]
MQSLSSCSPSFGCFIVLTSCPENTHQVHENISLLASCLKLFNDKKSQYHSLEFHVVVQKNEQSQLFKSIHLYKEYYSEILSRVQDYYKYNFNVMMPTFDNDKDLIDHVNHSICSLNNISQQFDCYWIKRDYEHKNHSSISCSIYRNNFDSIFETIEILNAEEDKNHDDKYSYLFNEQGDQDSKSLGTIEQYAKYHVVCVGGTFDRLHLGHKILLTQTLLLFNNNDSNCEKRREIEIGVSVDNLLKNKKYKELIQSFEVRRDKVLKCMKEINPALNLDFVNIFELYEPWGPIATDPELEVLVVSEETLNGAKKGNDLRVNEKNFKPYDIVCIPLLLPKSNGSMVLSDLKLSSTQLRELDLPKTSTE